MADKAVTVDRRAVLAALPPDARAGLTERRNGPGLIRFGLHLGAICALGAVVAAQPPRWGPPLPVRGVLFVFLFGLLHAAIHGTALRTQWLNAAVARIAPFAHAAGGLIPLFPPRASPPHAEPGARSGTGGALADDTARLSLANLRPAGLDRPCEGAHAKRARVRREARLMLAGFAAFAAFAFGSVCGRSSGPGRSRPARPAIPEALPDGRAWPPSAGRQQAGEHAATSTTALMRLLAWIRPCHAEHHHLPAAPFHRLPDLHAHLRETERGYTRFHIRTVHIGRAAGLGRARKA